MRICTPAHLSFLTVVLISASPAFAESTAEMLSSCKSVAEAEIRDQGAIFPQDYRSGMCWGAFNTLQSLIVKTNTDGRPMVGICAPAETRRTQLIAVFNDYARRNPQRHHEDFFNVAIDALRTAFPCMQH